MNINILYFLILLIKINFISLSFPKSPFNKTGVSFINKDILKEDWIIPSYNWSKNNLIKVAGYYFFLKQLFNLYEKFYKKKPSKKTEEEIMEDNKKLIQLISGNSTQNEKNNEIENLTKKNNEINEIVKNKYLYRGEYLKIPNPSYLFNKNKKKLTLLFFALSFNYLINENSTSTANNPIPIS